MSNIYTRRGGLLSLAALAATLTAPPPSGAAVASKSAVSFFAFQGGNFTLYAYKRWVERDSLGGVLATYTESTRSSGGVFLVQDDTKSTTMVDFIRHQISRSQPGGGQPTPQPIFGETSEVNAANVMRVGYQGGYFIMYGRGRWRESGNGRSFNFVETQRTATRVSLMDTTRNLFIDFDLADGMIYFSRAPGVVTQPLYAMTSRSATAYPTIVTPLYDAQ